MNHSGALVDYTPTASKRDPGAYFWSLQRAMLQCSSVRGGRNQEEGIEQGGAGFAAPPRCEPCLMVSVCAFETTSGEFCAFFPERPQTSGSPAPPSSADEGTRQARRSQRNLQRWRLQKNEKIRPT